MFKKLLLPVLALCLSSFANAGYIAFDEGVALQTGSISYDGNGGALIGTDIDFNTSTGGATPINAGAANSLECVSCLLNFATGANVSEGPAAWVFGAGGSFVLTGTLMDGLIQVATGTLLDGSFNGTPTAVGGNSNELFVGVGSLTPATGITDYFGLSSTQYMFANTELALGSCVDAGGSGGFYCGLQNADLAVTAAVPAPGTIALMGAGLALFGLARRKRL